MFLDICYNGPVILDRSVGIATQLRDWRSRHRNPARVKDFSPLPNVQMGSAPHPAPYPMGTGILSRGKSSRSVMLTNHLQPVPNLRMGGAMLLLPHICLHDVDMDTLTFIMGLSRRLFLALSQLGCLINLTLLFIHGRTALVSLGLLMFEFRAHSQTPHSAGLLWTSDRLVAKTSTWKTTHNIRNGQTSIPPAGFEPAIPASDRPQTYALDHTTTGIGPYWLVLLKLLDPLQLSLKSDYHECLT